jgi:hypothetical protein
VQEGAYVTLGLLIGMPTDMMLALSLASRLREILPNLPALVVWQHQEGRQLWRAGVSSHTPSSLARHTQITSSASGS